MSALVCSPTFPFLHTRAAVNPVNPLSYAGSQAHRRHNIVLGNRHSRLLNRLAKKNQVGDFWRVWFRCGEAQLIFSFCVVLLNALQVYSTVQNGEGIARKAGSGRFPHLSHVGKNHIKMFVAQNKYSSSDRIASDLATQQPSGEVIAVRTVRAAITCLKNWTDTAALKENFPSMMPTKMQFRAAIVAEWAALTPEEVEPFYSSISN